MRNKILILSLILFFAQLDALTLNQCIEKAKKNNKDILKAKEEIGEYKQSYRDVKGNLLPQLSLSGGYQYKGMMLPDSSVPQIPPLSLNLSSNATDDDRIIAGYIDGAFSNLIPEKTSKSNNLAANLKLTQVVFMGGKLINGINIASKLYHLQEKRYFLTEQEVVYKTIDMFYKTLLSQKVVEIQKEALQLAQKHLTQVQKMYNEGLVSEYDFLRAKLEVKKLTPQLLDAQKNNALATEALKKYLNVDDIKLEGDISLPKIEEINLKDATDTGLKKRMELKLASIAVDVSKVSLRYQKGNFLPNIALSAEYNYFGTSENKIEKDDIGHSYQVGIGFQMPLFTGFSNSAKTAKARHTLKKSILDYQKYKDLIKLDIKNSYLQLKEDKEAVESQKENVRLSQKALKIAESRYENQLSDQLEVFDAQLQVKVAKLGYLNSVYQTIIDNEKLKKAMGINLSKEVKNEK